MARTPWCSWEVFDPAIRYTEPLALRVTAIAGVLGWLRLAPVWWAAALPWLRNGALDWPHLGIIFC